MHPYITIQAPSLGYSVDDLLRIRKTGGVVRVSGLDVRDDGRFSAMRVTFASQAVMDGYLKALDGMSANNFKP